MTKSILVIGATGKQGSALINAILASPSANQYTLLALTRNAESPAAKKLIEKNVKIVQGDLNDVPAVFTKATEVSGGPIWGIFVVLVAQGRGASPDTEEAQGKAIVDEAIKSNIKYIVYSSVDRGGSQGSWDSPTNVPHFISKHNVEVYLREKAKGTELNWTILRPVAFMDNWNPGMFARLFTTIWRLKLPTQKLQLISVPDIGRIAAVCFESSDKYSGRAISLAGSSLTFVEAQKIFIEKTGIQTGMPESYEFMARGLTWMIKEVDLMFEWFANTGYKADINEVKEVYPNVLDWEHWLEKESEWKK